MTRFDVLAIGELNPDLVVSGIMADGPVLGTEQAFATRTLTLGSSTAIAAVLMARLGLRTGMVARVGDDDYGRFCRDALEREGLDTTNVVTLDGHSTGVTISLAYPHDRLLLTQYGTMTMLRGADVSDAMLSRSRHIHVGSYFIQTGLHGSLADLFARAKGLGATTSLDTGWDPQNRWMTPDLRTVLAQTDILLPNETEFLHLSGTDDPDRGWNVLRGHGVGEVVLKRGAQGSIYFGPQGMAAHPGFAATPRDTTGAGDSCNAGYIAARLADKPVTERLAWGNACGALTVQAVGGTGGVINRAQIEAFLAAQA
jgi:ribokinase